MKDLERKAAAIGQAAQRRALARIERTLREQRIAAQVQGDQVVLSGRGLVKRWLSEASLRLITGLMR
jgi:hypothetical protein